MFFLIFFFLFKHNQKLCAKTEIFFPKTNEICGDMMLISMLMLVMMLVMTKTTTIKWRQLKLKKRKLKSQLTTTEAARVKAKISVETTNTTRWRWMTAQHGVGFLSFVVSWLLAEEDDEATQRSPFAQTFTFYCKTKRKFIFFFLCLFKAKL